MNKYKKSMIVSIIFFICVCIGSILPGDGFFWKMPYICYGIGMIGIAVSVAIGTWSLDISNLKKILYIILQWIGYFVLILIWNVICFIFLD